MNARTATSQHEPLDLGALGRTWTPPRGGDLTPEVAEVLTALPAWAAHGLLYLAAAFVATALLWASLSLLDVVVAAPGALVPEGQVQPVQAEVKGTVRYVLVREGDRVKQGQVLLQLDRTQARAHADNVRDALAATDAEQTQLQATGAPLTDRTESRARVAQLRGELAAAEQALQQAVIRAPATGVVTTLAVRSEGAVVEAGQPVATIAPGDARLVAEVQMPNRDIAFVEATSRAKLKLDAFPFHDYGTIGAAVLSIAPDARFDAQQGSFYKVTLLPQQTHITANGKNLPLRTGLALTAEIITERRSVLSYLLAPFRKLRAEAGSLR